MKTRKLYSIAIDLETLLENLEGNQRKNPDCYSETGKIRCKFREHGSNKVVIIPKSEGKIEVTWEEREKI